MVPQVFSVVRTSHSLELMTPTFPPHSIRNSPMSVISLSWNLPVPYIPHPIVQPFLRHSRTPKMQVLKSHIVV